MMLVVSVVMLLLLGTVEQMAMGQPVTLGERVELFTDDVLIEQLSGDARQVMRRPQPREVVLTTDAPWEGDTSNYFTIFRDGDIYRMYYRGSSRKDPHAKESTRGEVTCYAQSDDGIHWTKPILSLCEWQGSKDNNIVWTGLETHNMTVFKDGNPAATAETLYKAVGKSGGPRPMISADGIRWEKHGDTPLVIDGSFDSQNLAFWDTVRGEYRLYWRIRPKGIRGIRTATSKTFVQWDATHTDLTYTDFPSPPADPTAVQLYTSAVQPYFRGPHLFVGFPTRYYEHGSSVEPVLITSRDGVHFARWLEPVIPRTAPTEREGNRSNYMAWGLVQLPDAPAAMSVYATEGAGGSSGSVRLRRFEYRLDGFVSVSAGKQGGELLTRPMTLTGPRLMMNHVTAVDGAIRVELQDADRRPIPGFTLEDCHPLTGDSVESVVRWKGDREIAEQMRAAPMRIRFVINSADLYSIRM